MEYTCPCCDLVYPYKDYVDWHLESFHGLSKERRRELGSNNTEEREIMNTGYIVHGSVIVPVRTSSNGNLVGTYNNASLCALYGRRHQEPDWPVVYPTVDAAEAVLSEAISRCAHNYEWLSHEETLCSSCGDIQFIPD